MTGLIELGGYKLKFDYNAICLIEGQTGPEIWQVFERGMERPSFIILRAIFWGGLHRHDPKKSLMDAGDILQTLMEKKGAVELSQELLEAVDKAFPEKGDNDGGGSAGNEVAG